MNTPIPPIPVETKENGITVVRWTHNGVTYETKVAALITSVMLTGQTNPITGVPVIVLDMSYVQEHRVVEPKGRAS